jgi:hypothetical protein
VSYIQMKHIDQGIERVDTCGDALGETTIFVPEPSPNPFK